MRRSWWRRVGGGRGFYAAVCLHLCVHGSRRICLCVYWASGWWDTGRLAAVISPHRSQFTLLHINIYSHPTPTVKTLLSEQEMKRQRSALKSEEKEEVEGGENTPNKSHSAQTNQSYETERVAAEAAAPSGPLLKRRRKKPSSFPFPTVNTNISQLRKTGESAGGKPWRCGLWCGRVEDMRSEFSPKFGLVLR